MIFSFDFSPAAPPAAAPATVLADTAAFSALATVTKAMAEIKTEILNAFFMASIVLRPMAAVIGIERRNKTGVLMEKISRQIPPPPPPSEPMPVGVTWPGPLEIFSLFLGGIALTTVILLVLEWLHLIPR